MIDLFIFIFLVSVSALALLFLWEATQILYADKVRMSYRRVTKLDGPLVLFMLLLSGCATERKTIVLRNMPSTIVVHRGNDVSEEHCSKPKLWGCAQRFPLEDKCVISLDWDRGIGTTLHEFGHCAGENEDDVRALVSPE